MLNRYIQTAGLTPAQQHELVGLVSNLDDQTRDKLLGQAIEAHVGHDEVVRYLNQLNDPQQRQQQSAPVPDADSAQPARQTRRQVPQNNGIRGKISGLIGRITGRKMRGDDDPSSDDSKKGGLSGVVVWIVIAVIVLAVAFFFIQSGPPDLGAITQFHGVRLAGPEGVNFVLRFATVIVIFTSLIGFLEASSRRDPLLMDWWMPYVLWAGLVYVGKQPELTFWNGAFVFIPLGALIIAAFWNRGEEFEGNWWDRFDTSGTFAVCFLLTITYLAKWETVPYPNFVPLPLVLGLGAFSLFKEMVRSSKEFLFGIGAIFLGATAGFFMTWTWFLVTLALTVIAVYIASSQEWIPTSSGRRTESQQTFGHFVVKVIMAWDVMYAYWAGFAFAGLFFYGNYAAIILASR